MDFKSYKEFHPNFQHNLVLNLLGREIGSEYLKYRSIRDAYRHPYQLLASTKPNYFFEVDFNRCETPDPDQPDFDTLADCLGFSPNGKYLAFHSHAHSAISVLTYSGIEGGKEADKGALPSHFFGKRSKIELANLTRNYNYEDTKAIGSWWTDDSSTIIVQLSMEVQEDEDDQNDQEEEVLVHANNLIDDQRNFWNVQDPEYLSPPETIRNHRNEDREPRQQIRDNPSMESDANSLDVITNTEDVEESEFHSDEEVIKTVLEQQSGCEKSMCELLVSLGNEFGKVQHGETSRTVPVLSAIEAAANLAFDGERVKGETSRTMPVYHALTSSMLEREGVESEEEEENDPSVPSTSKCTHRPPISRDQQLEEPEEKRMKIESFENISVADKLREALKFKKEKEGSKDKQNEGKMRSILRWLRSNPDNAKVFSREGGNSSGLGYSKPGSNLRSHDTNKYRRISYADRLRETIEQQEQANESDEDKDIKSIMVFVAYNVEEDYVAPLFFMEVSGKFHCHMRDRKLTVAYNCDLIETFHLPKGRSRWENQNQYRLSKKESIHVQLHYRTGTAPGMPSRNDEVENGQVFDDLFCLDYFHSPIKQDVATLLYRDMPEWANLHNIFLTETPEVSKCHMITDELLAITMTYADRAYKIPIHLGVTISLLDMSVTLYPDYHNYLKILFTHHFSDLMPRHWSYLNPSPVAEQAWFKKGLIDISDPYELNNMERLLKIYDFLSKNWNNVKSVSNPFINSPFNNTCAHHILGKFSFYNGEKVSTFNIPNDSKVTHIEHFYHPTDPFILINNFSRWLFALSRKDPDDVVVHID